MSEARVVRPLNPGERFAKTSLDLIEHLADIDLSGTEERVYLFIRVHMNAHGRAWPCNKTIAAAVRKTVRTVARAKRKLESVGLLIARPRHTAAGGQLSTLYEVPPVSGGDDTACHPNEQTIRTPLYPLTGNRGARARAREAPAFADATPPNPTPGFSQNLSEEKGEARPPRQPPPRPRKPHRLTKTPLPDDWTPTAADRSYAYEKGYDDDWIERNTRKFRHSHQWKGTLFADISAGWRYWIDCEPELAQRRRPADRPNPVEQQQARRAALYRVALSVCPELAA